MLHDMRLLKSDIRLPNEQKARERLIFLAFSLFFLLPASAWAQDPAAHARAGEAATHWTVDDGLPINAVTDIAQDQDDFLWLTTRAGLVRFDGLSFKTYNSRTSTGLPSDRLIKLYRTPDQSLWIQTEQLHLVRFSNGAFHSLADWEGLSDAQVQRVRAGPEGWLVLGLRDGLAVLDEHGPRRILEDHPRGISEAVTWASPQRLWAVVSGSLLAVSLDADGANMSSRNGMDESAEATATLQQSWTMPAYTMALLETDSTLWIGTEAGLYRLELPLNANSQPVLDAEFPREDIFRLAAHPNGGILIDTGDAIWWRNSNTTTQLYAGNTPRIPIAFTIPFQDQTGIHLGQGLVQVGEELRDFGVPIRAALIDQAGNTWLALYGGGLKLHRPSSVRLLGSPEGLPGDNTYSIFQARDGAVWTSILGQGTVRIDPDPNAANAFTEFEAGIVWSIAEFEDGIWLGGKPCQVVGSRCIDRPLPRTEDFDPGMVNLLYRDQQGRGWLGTEFGGLYEKHGDQWLKSALMNERWPINSPIRTAAQAADGALWFGTNGNGIVRIAGRDIEQYSAQHGLASDLIRDLWFDPSGDLFVATENRGLCRLKRRAESETVETRIDCLSKTQGLFSDSLHQIQPDDRGRLWISTNQGIFWLDQADIAQVLNGEQARISQTGTINAMNGLRNSELNGGAYPSGLRDRYGRLWWPSQSGLVVMDPSVDDPVGAPTVRGIIDQMTVNNRAYEINQPSLTLPSGDRNVQLTLTAAAFTDPSNVQFRFRVPQIDPDWLETGRSRLIGPLTLPPGRIEITTQARAGAGPWGEPSQLQITVPYFWYEYRTVQVAIGGLLLALLTLSIRARMQRQANYNQQLERTIEQRTAELRHSQQETEAALGSVQRTAELRTELFANIGHELRTPLTLISGPLEDAIEGGRSLNTTSLTHMQRSSQRMQRLVKQILDLRQTDIHSFALERKPLELIPLLQQCCAPFAELAARTGLALVVKSNLTQATAALDADAFEKIIGNLLSNALKFSPTGATVTVELSAGSNDSIDILVKDQGPGVALDEAEPIFERFYRAKASRERAIEGTGIGLSLARKLARLHEGDIRVHNPGAAGAQFLLHLPAVSVTLADAMTVLEGPAIEPALDHAATDSPTESDSPIVETAASGSNELHTAGLASGRSRPRVLVIEDDAGLRDYIVNCLNDRYELLEANNGSEGLALTRASKPDLVITDVMMPGMDGFSVMRELRSDAVTAAIPTLMLTALGQSAEVEGLESGADDYLSKPFNREQLRARINARLKDRERVLQALAQWRQEMSEQLAAQNDSTKSEVNASSPHPLVEKARRQIMLRLHDAEYGVAELAQDLHVSRSHLYRAIVEHDGRKPGQLLREMRLEAAGKLLNDGFSVLEVAIATGFTGATVFSRSFKQYYGCPPSQWR